MPYIKKDLRVAVEETGVWSTGELNFAIHKAIASYVENKPANYETWNDVIGALENAKLEFYRRVITPYEDRKIKENGDVEPYIDLMNRQRALLP